MKYKETQIGKVPTHWNVLPIKEIAEVVTDYVANGSFASLAKNVVYKDEEDFAVLIRLVDYNNDFRGKFVFIDEHAYEFLSKSKLYGNEIIISNVGANVGIVFRCPKLRYKMSLAPNSVMVKFKGNDDFYFHWLRGYNGQQMLKSIVTGSAQPKFNKTNFKEMVVPVPPIGEQNKIASILNSIEEKIKLNKQINENLLEQATALFDNALQQSESISFVELSSLADVKGGKRLPKGVNLISKPNSHPYIRVRNLNNMIFASLSSDYEYVDDETQKSIARYITSAGDVLVSIVGTIGLTAIVDDTLDNANLTENCVKLTNLKGITPEYLLLFLRSKIGIESINKGTVGAVQLKLPIKNIQSIPVPLLMSVEMQALSDILSIMFNRISSNIIETKRLSELRDVLLPKLMSGELGVSDIDL